MADTLKQFAENLTIIGCGNMAGAMLARWLDAGLSPAQVAVIDPGAPDLAPGIAHHASIADWAAAGGRAEYVMIATKPQQFAEVAAALAGQMAPTTHIISIMAGVSLADTAGALPGAAAYARLMPALPVRVGAGVMVLTLAAGGAAPAHLAATTAQLAAPLGTVVELADDGQMDLVTAFTGSGPAFVMRLIEAYAAAGERLGLSTDQALTLANQTFGGTSALLSSGPTPPGEWVNRVASKGGMTQAGLDVLDAEGRLVNLLTDVLRATRDRGRELADLARG